MTSFQPPSAFQAKDLQLLPLRFERASGDRVLVANFAGEIHSYTESELSRLVSLDVAPGDELYAKAFSHLLVADKGQRSSLELLALRTRSRYEFLKYPTILNIFVVTLRCEHSCPYCQVSRRSADKLQFDMSEEMALKGLEVAFSSPSPLIKIEFQGGEPLLNFDLIRFIVSAAKRKAAEVKKDVQFVITSNLALLTDDVLTFCEEHGVLLSTSLDGPRDLHNKNRPRPGNNSYELAAEGIKRAQQALGSDRVGALMTTTVGSLHRVEEIVDEYVKLGIDGIFLRPLSPYGFAIKTKARSRYNFDEWLEFYFRGLRYVLDINRKGHRFPEYYAKLLVQRLVSDKPTGYVDLRSPAGTGLGALVYNYDGKVFASDEGRMLAEMGDKTFELGDLNQDRLGDLLLSDRLVDMITKSLSQTSPQCHSCVFESQCGADPVFHHATQGDAVGIKPFSEFCSRQMTILKHLIDLLENSPEDADILKGWLQ